MYIRTFVHESRVERGEDKTSEYTEAGQRDTQG